MNKVARVSLSIVTAFVALTALAGGTVLILGSVIPDMRSSWLPPDDYLAGSPFTSYVIPGAALVVLVAIPHALASVAGAIDSIWTPLVGSVAGFSCLIWIFVQMIYIPFSGLQALYFAAGLIELSLVLLMLGVVSRRPVPRAVRSTASADEMVGRLIS